VPSMPLARARIVRGLVAALVATLGGVAVDIGLAARQREDQASQSIDARLARIAADVFSSTDHVDADIAELKAILAADPRSGQAHMLLGLASRTIGPADLEREAAGEPRQVIDLEPSRSPARLFPSRVDLDTAQPARARARGTAGVARPHAWTGAIAGSPGRVRAATRQTRGRPRSHGTGAEGQSVVRRGVLLPGPGLVRSQAS